MTTLPLKRYGQNLMAWVASPVGCFTLGSLFYLITLFTRSDGIGGDEAGYLSLARNRAGLHQEFYVLGKPPVFYFLNLLVLKYFGNLIGPWEPLSVSIFYCFLMVASLLFLAAAVGNFTKRKNITLIFLLFLLNPLVFYHGTHLLMESLSLILVNFLFGSILFLLGEYKKNSGSKLWPRIGIWVATILSVSTKETAIPVLLIPCGVFFLTKKYRNESLTFGFSLLLGILFRILIKKWMHAASLTHTYYLNPFASEHVVAQVSRMGSYARTWIFFIWPPLFLMTIYQTLRNPKKTDAGLILWSVFIISILGSCCVALISELPAPRYCFPLVWTASIASVILLLLSKNIKAEVLVVVSLVLPIFSFFRPTPEVMKLWPEFFRDDMQLSGATILGGVPFFGWLLKHPPKKSDRVCVGYRMKNGEMNVYIPRFFVGYFNGAQILDLEKHQDLMESPECTYRIGVMRQYTNPPGICEKYCGQGIYREERCLVQTIRFFSENGYSHDNPGFLTSGACLK